MNIMMRFQSWLSAPKMAFASGFMVTMFVLCAPAQAQVPSQTFHPHDPILFFSAEGELDYLSEYKKTALYKALHESGFSGEFKKGFQNVIQKLNVSRFNEVLQHVKENGISVSLATDPAQPNNPAMMYLTIVADSAGDGVGVFNTVVESLAKGKVEIQTTRVQNRYVNHIVIPEANLLLTWRTEDSHLVLTLSLNEISNALKNSVDIAIGKAESLKTNPIYQELSGNLDGKVLTQLMFLNYAKIYALVEPFEIPVPGRQPMKISEVTDALGVSNLQVLKARGGFTGKACWSELSVQVDGEKTGLLSVIDQQTFSLNDLPVVPAEFSAVHAKRNDPVGTYKTIVEVVRNVAGLFPEVGTEKIDEALVNLKGRLGVSVEDLLSTVDDLQMTIIDQSGGPLSVGVLGMNRLKDAEGFKQQFRTLVTNVISIVHEEAREDGLVSMKETTRNGVTSFQITLTKIPLYSLNVTVTKDWLLVSPSNQTIQAQLMRLEGKLPSVKLADLQEVKDFAPEQMRALSVTDARPAVKVLIPLIPFVGGLIETGLRNSDSIPPGEAFPFDYSNIPPAEAINMHLFLNVGVTVEEDGQFKVKTLSSLPM